VPIYLSFVGEESRRLGNFKTVMDGVYPWFEVVIGTWCHDSPAEKVGGRKECCSRVGVESPECRDEIVVEGREKSNKNLTVMPALQPQSGFFQALEMPLEHPMISTF
jgi:hypothetical protein